MRRHSRAHARHHRERIAERTRRRILNTWYLSPQLDTEGYFEEMPQGRLRDHRRCGCRHCRWVSYIQSFAVHKHALYRMLDKIEAA